jgi:hypothetical protein
MLAKQPTRTGDVQFQQPVHHRLVAPQRERVEDEPPLDWERDPSTSIAEHLSADPSTLVDRNASNARHRLAFSGSFTRVRNP